MSKENLTQFGPPILAFQVKIWVIEKLRSAKVKTQERNIFKKCIVGSEKILIPRKQGMEKRTEKQATNSHAVIITPCNGWS